MTDTDDQRRARESADAIEQRHREAAFRTVERHGLDAVRDDLDRGGHGPAAGSLAFRDALRRIVAEKDAERPDTRWVVALFAVLLVAVVVWLLLW